VFPPPPFILCGLPAVDRLRGGLRFRRLIVAVEFLGLLETAHVFRQDAVGALLFNPSSPLTNFDPISHPDCVVRRFHSGYLIPLLLSGSFCFPLCYSRSLVFTAFERHSVSLYVVTFSI